MVFPLTEGESNRDRMAIPDPHPALRATLSRRERVNKPS